MDVREEGDIIPIATVTTRMAPPLRWAAMRAIKRETIIIPIATLSPPE